MCATMIISIIPSMYCVPSIVLSALPTLLHLILVTVEYKLQGAITSKNSIAFVLRGVAEYLFSILLNLQHSE